MDYPVLDQLQNLKEALLHKRIVILQAPPGAGKSTVLPLALLEEPWLQGQKMVMLEPRRLATRSVARRMAALREEPPGETVGYRMRFEQVASAKTRIEVITEGILTRMIQTDNALEGIGMIIFDEFHERSLHADLSFALSLQLQQILRDDLRILIMSATLDGEKLKTMLPDAAVITSAGRQHPVSIHYQEDADDLLANTVSRAIKRALREQTGDVLAFLPGTADIRRTQERLAEVSAEVYPLYGELPFQKQQEAIMPHPGGARKVVLATAIAETSLTIEGITTVVDSGYARVPRFDPRSGLTRLETIRVTRDAADQRAGRAGRLGPGVCYRLWSEKIHHHLAPHRTPEIEEADLAPLLLELAAWGIKDMHALTWLTLPPPGAISQASTLLTQLEAIQEGGITPRGRKMVALPTHPRLAHMLIVASENKTMLSLATDLAALLEERDPLPKEAGADLSLRVEALRRWRSGVRVQADVRILERVERLAVYWRKLWGIRVSNDVVADEESGFLLAAAYPERVARQVKAHDERYKLVNARNARLPVNDPLTRCHWLAIAYLDAGQGEGKIFLAAPLHDQDLIHLAHDERVVRWDYDRGRVVALEEKKVGNLVLSSKNLPTIPDEERLAVIFAFIRAEGLKVMGWDKAQATWQARVMSLRHWRPEESWPAVDDVALLATIETWLAPFLTNIVTLSDLQRLDLSAMITTVLSWEQQNRLETLAPIKLQVPSGSWISLQYFPDGRPPVMEVRLQEVFGMEDTPQINQGQTRIMMHLLSPGYRPVQVTQDLKSFWTTTYHEVRKELRARYPKHSWPEDPWQAEPVRGVKRKPGNRS